MDEIREYNFWLHVHPAEDIDGEWVAHCLDLDVVSQGNSLKNAFDMVIEATLMVVCDDLNAGRDPLERRAPKKFWDPMWAIVQKGNKLERNALAEGKVDQKTVAHYVASIQVTARGVPREDATGSKKQKPDRAPSYELPVGGWVTADL